MQTGVEVMDIKYDRKEMTRIFNETFHQHDLRVVTSLRIKSAPKSAELLTCIQI